MASKTKTIGMTESKLLTTQEAAEIIGLHPVTLSNMRMRKYGPPYVKLGQRCVRYPLHRLEEWLTKSVVVPDDERVA
jgi:predicted DNA-binding transcriptional regulator AlpA